MHYTIELSKFTKDEKLDLFESLWKDLSSDEANFISPDWHSNILKETESRVNDGSEKLYDWEKAKEILSNQSE